MKLEDPPTRQRYKWLDRLDPLMAYPGQWGVVWHKDTPGDSYSAVSALRSGRCKCPPGRWEFRGSMEGKIYAKYLGP